MSGVLVLSSAVLYYNCVFVHLLSASNRAAMAVAVILFGAVAVAASLSCDSRYSWQHALLWAHRFFVCFYTTAVIKMEYSYSYYYVVNTGLLLLAIGHLIRFLLMARLRQNFVGPDRLQWYKDVIKLERIFYTALTGAKHELSDVAVLEMIARNPRRLDPKVYFCLFSDCAETRELLGRFVVLDIIRSCLKDAGQSVGAGEPSAEIGAAHGRGAESIYTVIQQDLLGTPRRRGNNGATVLESPGRDVATPGGVVSDDYVPAKDRRMIDLRSVSALDVHWLTEKNSFIKVYKGSKGCLQVEEEAYKALRRLEKLQLKGLVTLDSLRDVLPLAAAQDCFRILTQRFEPVLAFPDFEGSMRQLNNIRGCFISTLQNNQKTLDLVGTILLALELLVVFALLYVFFNFGTVFEVVGSCFIFLVPVIWSVFDSFMFLIVSHPYDVGDRIYIDGMNLIVKDIGLTCTIFEKWNNDYVVIPNTYIHSKVIHNIRRSKNQQGIVSFFLAADTPAEALDGLKNNLKAFVANNPAFEHISVTFDEIRDCQFYKMSFIVKHAINHQNGFFMLKVQNKFMTELVRQCNELGISYTLPEMHVVANGP
ncbi:hypothetical protein PAPHI01_1564 [Pancytospora philotis]|nr:hypothetical protein PAPHI01_1547 [Pancytospora philotis]KAI4292290.1 hypothetical protein PAPHI01_1564 [Pancytospora philotis]